MSKRVRVISGGVELDRDHGHVETNDCDRDQPFACLNINSETTGGARGIPARARFRHSLIGAFSGRILRRSSFELAALAGNQSQLQPVMEVIRGLG